MFRKEKHGLGPIVTVGTVILLLLLIVALAFGQRAVIRDDVARSENEALETRQVLEPVFSNYRGIGIGTTEAELLERINTSPRFQSEDDYVYVFSDSESAQFLLDEERKVKMISIGYFGDLSNAPTYQDVFGLVGEINKTADGKVYNLVNYPNAGYWIAYYKSTADQPIVTITIQKL